MGNNPMRQRPPLLDRPCDDELPVHGALLRWAEWCRVRWRPARAGSAEGSYAPEAQNVFNPPGPRPVVDPVLAVAVNAGLLALPERERRGLRLRYHERLPDRIIAKMLAVHHAAYQAFLRGARLMLRNVLRRNGVRL